MDSPEDLVRVLYPVSVCMVLAVYIHSGITGSGGGCGPSQVSAHPLAIIGFDQEAPDLATAIAIVVIFSVATVISTFCLMRLYACGAAAFIRGWMMLSVVLALGKVGGRTLLLWLQAHCLLDRTDSITYLFVVWNFTVGGFVAIFYKSPRLVNQGYMVVLGALISNLIAGISSQSTWAILLVFVVWDLYAVLSKSGPLRKLVEISRARNEKLPALVYDTNPYREVPMPPRLREQIRDENIDSESENLIQAESAGPSNGEIQVEDPDSAGPSSSSRRRFLQLGLGDFIFYSILVIRSSISGSVSALISFISILAGLLGTLLLLLRAKRALPALPISIVLGIAAHFLSWIFLVPFVEHLQSRILFV